MEKYIAITVVESAVLLVACALFAFLRLAVGYNIIGSLSFTAAIFCLVHAFYWLQIGAEELSDGEDDTDY